MRLRSSIFALCLLGGPLAAARPASADLLVASSGTDSMDSGGILDPVTHLLCYKVRPAQGEPRHAKRSGVHTANGFGAGQLDTLKEEKLCLPAAIAVPGARPARR